VKSNPTKIVNEEKNANLKEKKNEKAMIERELRQDIM